MRFISYIYVLEPLAGGNPNIRDLTGKSALDVAKAVESFFFPDSRDAFHLRVRFFL
jgi:hypothetical protein